MRPSIEDAIKLRNAMESSIEEIIDKYEKATGLIVTDILIDDDSEPGLNTIAITVELSI